MSDQTIRILLIEDNPGDARLIREMLNEAEGIRFDLVAVDRLSDGLQCLRADGIDLVLLDLSLPDSQGMDTLAQVSMCAPNIPVVVMTGLEDQRAAVEAVQEGAQDYLLKSDTLSGNRPVFRPLWQGDSSSIPYYAPPAG